MRLPPPVVAGPITLAGDWQRLDDLEAAWRRQATRYQPALAAALSKRSVDLARDQFRTQRDPNGVPWQPSKRASGQQLRRGRATAMRRGRVGYRNAVGLTLVDTGELLRSIHVAALREDGFTVNASKIYAAIHQYGGPIGGFLAGQGVRMPKRSFFPIGTLGPLWGPAWEETARRVWLAGFEEHGLLAG